MLRPGIGVNPAWDMSKKLWHVDNGKTTMDNSGQNYRTFKVVFGPEHLQVYRETEAKNGVDFENEPFMEARDFKTEPEDGFSTGIKKISKVLLITFELHNFNFIHIFQFDRFHGGRTLLLRERDRTFAPPTVWYLEIFCLLGITKQFCRSKPWI